LSLLGDRGGYAAPPALISAGASYAIARAISTSAILPASAESLTFDDASGGRFTRSAPRRLGRDDPGQVERRRGLVAADEFVDS
jgi:hypothetical protein